jgi:hypothetical protein
MCCALLCTRAHQPTQHVCAHAASRNGRQPPPRAHSQPAHPRPDLAAAPGCCKSACCPIRRAVTHRACRQAQARVQHQHRCLHAYRPQACCSTTQPAPRGCCFFASQITELLTQGPCVFTCRSISQHQCPAWISRASLILSQAAGECTTSLPSPTSPPSPPSELVMRALSIVLSSNLSWITINLLV